jgi:hypothetical protein
MKKHPIEIQNGAKSLVILATKLTLNPRTMLLAKFDFKTLHVHSTITQIRLIQLAQRLLDKKVQYFFATCPVRRRELHQLLQAFLLAFFSFAVEALFYPCVAVWFNASANCDWIRSFRIVDDM